MNDLKIGSRIYYRYSTSENFYFLDVVSKINKKSFVTRDNLRFSSEIKAGSILTPLFSENHSNLKPVYYLENKKTKNQELKKSILREIDLKLSRSDSKISLRTLRQISNLLKIKENKAQ